jgi:hypothetical protein
MRAWYLFFSRHRLLLEFMYVCGPSLQTYAWDASLCVGIMALSATLLQHDFVRALFDIESMCSLAYSCLARVDRGHRRRCLGREILVVGHTHGCGRAAVVPTMRDCDDSSVPEA